ncbi:hypothetical protein V5T82_03855 [Magnetovibrio sp. PR-2]|uniref:hypothetical protein n=1 Tax=Magnetovibrio sp. PR-2 TaxID=3120356 RepID=UPI002FCDFF33
MDGLTLFLVIFGIGTGFIALWVVADVSRRLTKRTNAVMAEAQADMVRVIKRYDRNMRILSDKINDLEYDVTKLKKDHKREVARLKTALAEAEHNQLRRQIAANSL